MREIPASEWMQFLTQFSQDHEGQAADISSAQPQTPLHMQARGLPLLGITAEGPAEDRCVEVIAASADGTLFDHTIQHTRRIRLREWNEGISAELEIIGDGAMMTRVRVGPVEPILPPGVIADGI